MRTKTVPAPMLLIVLGLLFLLSNLGLLPPLGPLFVRGWPLILVAVGVMLLFRRIGQPSAPRICRRLSIGAGTDRRASGGFAQGLHGPAQSADHSLLSIEELHHVRPHRPPAPCPARHATPKRLTALQQTHAP